MIILVIWYSSALFLYYGGKLVMRYKPEFMYLTRTWTYAIVVLHVVWNVGRKAR